jgi:hypothetical protein
MQNRHSLRQWSRAESAWRSCRRRVIHSVRQAGACVFSDTWGYNATAWLYNHQADGQLPVDSSHDWGFHVQRAFYPISKKLEVFGAVSEICALIGAEGEMT